MNWASALATHLLFLSLLTVLLLNTVVNGIVGRRFLALLAADPARRKRVYRRYLVNAWIMAALVPAIVFLSDDLSAADVGWARPSGDGLAYPLTALFVLVSVIGGLRARGRMRRGHEFAARARISVLIPRTTRQRWAAVAFAVTAGITEEVIYRGLLIGAGTGVYHLPTAMAVVASGAIFVAAHAYQGRRAMLGIVFLTFLLTGLYVLSGSLLLVIVFHICADLVALLIIPAFPSSPREPVAGTDYPIPATRPANDDAPGSGTRGRPVSPLVIRPATPASTHR